MINQERLQQGIAALRSGEYERGHGRLHRVANGRSTWCCLGVLSDVAQKNGCPVTRRITADFGQGENEVFGEYLDEYLSPQVMEWYGFTDRDPELRDMDDDPVRASGLNDDVELDVEPGFGYIADAFERTFGTNSTESEL